MNFIASHPDLVRATYPELKETELLRAVERALESIFKKATVDNKSMNLNLSTCESRRTTDPKTKRKLSGMGRMGDPFLLTAAFWRKWIRAGFSIGSGKARDRKNVREDGTPPALLFNQKPRLLRRFDSPAQTLIPLLGCREK